MQFIFFSCGNADATDECWGSLLALDCIVWGRQVFFLGREGGGVSGTQRGGQSPHGAPDWSSKAPCVGRVWMRCGDDVPSSHPPAPRSPHCAFPPLWFTDLQTERWTAGSGIMGAVEGVCHLFFN